MSSIYPTTWPPVSRPTDPRNQFHELAIREAASPPTALRGPSRGAASWPQPGLRLVTRRRPGVRAPVLQLRRRGHRPPT